MAHLREIGGPCEGPTPGLACPGRRQAVVELLDRFNASRGLYCRECGGRRLRELERAEGHEPAATDRPEQERQARELRYERGLSLRAVAADMGVSVTQVRR